MGIGFSCKHLSRTLHAPFSASSCNKLEPDLVLGSSNLEIFLTAYYFTISLSLLTSPISVLPNLSWITCSHSSSTLRSRCWFKSLLQKASDIIILCMCWCISWNIFSSHLHQNMFSLNGNFLSSYISSFALITITRVRILSISLHHHYHLFDIFVKCY